MQWVALYHINSNTQETNCHHFVKCSVQLVGLHSRSISRGDRSPWSQVYPTCCLKDTYLKKRLPVVQINKLLATERGYVATNNCLIGDLFIKGRGKL